MLGSGRVAAYVRVSSKAQSCGLQRDAITRAALACGDTIDEWLEEVRSARTAQRPVLDALRRRARRGEFRRLYVFRLDRLMRSGVRDTFNVLEELKQSGCQVKTVSDPIDLEGPTADIQIAVLALAAKLELTAIGERVAAARERVESRGGRWGRPPRMTAQQVETAQRMRANGHTVRGISKAIHVPLTTVSRLVCRKTGRKWGIRALNRSRRRTERKRELASAELDIKKSSTTASL